SRRRSHDGSEPVLLVSRCPMRLPATLVMCCLTTLPAIAQNAAPGSADDAAREKRDAKLLEALLPAGADQLVTAGEWRQGRDNVVRGGLASSQANPGSRPSPLYARRSARPGVPSA